MRAALAIGLTALLLAPAPARAWVVCMPFCDTCSVATMTTAATTSATTLGLISGAVRQDASELDSAISAVEQLSGDVTETLGDEHENTLAPAISALREQILLELAKNLKAQSDLSDVWADEVVAAVRNNVVFGSALDTRRELEAEAAQPSSGRIGVCRAVSLGSSQKASRDIRDAVVERMQQYNNSATLASKNMQGRLTASLAGRDPNDFVLASPAAATWPIEEVDRYNLAITLSTNPTPWSASGAQSAQAAVARLRWNIGLGVVQTSLASRAMERAPLLPADWLSAYAGSADEFPDGRMSVTEHIERETDGRLVASEWVQEQALATEAGVLREQVYEIAAENQLLLNLLQRQLASNRLRAVKLAFELEGLRPR